MLKQIKWTSVGLALAEIAAGVLLIIFPALSSDVICYLVGVGACIYGVISLTQYFLLSLEDSLFRNEFVIGIMSLLAGILIMVKKDLIRAGKFDEITAMVKEAAGIVREVRG